MAEAEVSSGRNPARLGSIGTWLSLIAQLESWLGRSLRLKATLMTEEEKLRAPNIGIWCTDVG